MKTIALALLSLPLLFAAGPATDGPPKRCGIERGSLSSAGHHQAFGGEPGGQMLHRQFAGLALEFTRRA